MTLIRQVSGWLGAPVVILGVIVASVWLWHMWLTNVIPTPWHGLLVAAVLVLVGLALLAISRGAPQAEQRRAENRDADAGGLHQRGDHLFEIALGAFLALGIAAGALAGGLRDQGNRPVSGGRLIEFRDLNPSTGVAVRDISEVAGYGRVTLLTRAAAPENSSATVTVYGVRDEGAAPEIMRVESASAAWSRWEREVTYSRIRILVEPPSPGAVAATQVEALVYLSPRAPSQRPDTATVPSAAPPRRQP